MAPLKFTDSPVTFLKRTLCFMGFIRVHGGRGCKFRAAAQVPACRPATRISLTSLPQRNGALLFRLTIFPRCFSAPREISDFVLHFRVGTSTRSLVRLYAINHGFSFPL